MCLGSTTSACATYSDKTDAARDALTRGDYPGSVKQWNKILKVRGAEDLPKKWKKNHALVILERATVLQAMREYEASASNFSVADKELELLDIARDGMMSGPNYDALAEMRAATRLPVIASGGVSDLEQVRRLAETGTFGCIVGRALYEGSFSLSEALALVRATPQAATPLTHTT